MGGTEERLGKRMGRHRNRMKRVVHARDYEGSRVGINPEDGPQRTRIPWAADLPHEPGA
jgi:hypothetical protein